jgi:putative transposase
LAPKVKYYNQSLSRCQKGSNRRKKVKQKLARVHQKIRRQRQDYLHKLSTGLVKYAKTISIETLNVIKMFQDRRLSGSLGDAALGELLRQIEYKCALYGKELVKCDQYYASTQLCSRCDHKNTHMKDLSQRVFTCEHCGYSLGRDKNAAKNMYRYGKDCPPWVRPEDHVEVEVTKHVKREYHEGRIFVFLVSLLNSSSRAPIWCVRAK